MTQQKTNKGCIGHYWTNVQNIEEQLKNAIEGLNQCLELAERDDWWMKGIWYWTSQIASLRESLRYALKDDE